jgi:hypothetical protein
MRWYTRSRADLVDFPPPLEPISRRWIVCPQDFSETDIWCDLTDLLGYCMLTPMPLSPSAGESTHAKKTWMATRLHSCVLDEPVDDCGSFIEDAP